MTPSAVFSIVEMDLGESVPVALVSIETIGSEAALGLMAVIEASPWQGRRVRLELVDRNAGASFAWIGISEVVMMNR
jgi:hypothetical protein